HLALGRPAYLDEFLELYVAWLRNHDLTHSRQVFHRWLEWEYCPRECRCTLEFLEKPDYVFRGEHSAIRIRARNDGIKPWRFRPGTDAGIHACLILRDWEGNTLGLHRAGLFDAEVAVGAR